MNANEFYYRINGGNMNQKLRHNKKAYCSLSAYKNSFLCFSLLIFLFTVVTHSEDNPIQVQIDPPEVGVGDTFTVIVSVQGTNVGEPVVTSDNGVKINPQPVYNGTSTQMQFGFGQSRIMTTKERHYRGYAQQEGEWKIYVQVDVDGKQYISPEITIKVSKNASSQQVVPQVPSFPQQQSGTLPGRRRQPQTSGRQADQSLLDQALILESEVSKRIVFQGEILTLTLRAKILSSPDISIQTATGNLPDIPNLDEFYVGKVQQTTSQEEIAGRIYRVIELTVPICPKGVGTLTINPWDWNSCYIRYYNNWGWPDTYPLTKSTNPINLEVRALPNSPANFYGAVGKFTLTSNLSQTEADVGTPLFLSITIRGSGYPDFIRAPAKPNLDWAYISEPEIISGNTDTWENIEKTIRFSLTPLKPGEYVIPVIEYDYFNPQLGQYATLRTNPFTVRIKGETKDVSNVITAGGTPRVETRNIDVVGTDLLPLITEGVQLKPRGTFYKGGMTVVFIFTPILSLISLGLGLRKEYLRKNPVYLRKISAYTNAIRKFNELKTGEGVPIAVEQSIKQYIGDATGVENVSGLTSDDVEDIMRNKKIDEKLIQKTVKLLRTCERIRYSGSNTSLDENRGIEEGFTVLLEELRRVLG